MYPGNEALPKPLRGNGGTNTYSAGPSDPIARATVQGSLEEQERTIIDLHQCISELEARLTPVLGPPPPSTDSAGKAPIPSTLMSRVDQHNRAIIGARTRIGELLGRLEI